MSYEHRNAVISRTFLGVEDHGIFTFNLTLDYGGSGQGAGSYNLQSNGHEAKNGFRLLRQIIGIVGAESWESLPGKHVVALIEGGLVRGLAPILLDGPPVIFAEVLDEGREGPK